MCYKHFARATFPPGGQKILKNGTFGISQAFPRATFLPGGAKDFEKRHLWDFTALLVRFSTGWALFGQFVSSSSGMCAIYVIQFSHFVSLLLHFLKQSISLGDPPPHVRNIVRDKGE